MTTKLKYPNIIYFALLSPRKLKIRLIEGLLDFNHICFQKAAPKKKKKASKTTHFFCLFLQKIAFLNLSFASTILSK